MVSYGEFGSHGRQANIIPKMILWWKLGFGDLYPEMLLGFIYPFELS